MASELLSYAGWYFLPNLVTSYAQSILYTVFIRAGDPKPPPGSARYIRDRKIIHSVVILAYLLYTIYEADYRLRQTSDFYQVLGVPHDVDERTLQSKFRRLTVQYHPDKATGADRTNVEAIYVHLKLARDTLVDPAKRFAYDRFGLDSLQWRGCKTIRDYVFTGAQGTAVSYVASFGLLVLLGVLGYLPTGMFWRYLVMAGMFVTEVSVITRPKFPWLLREVLNPLLFRAGVHPPLLPFQILTLLRKAAITFFIALSLLGPVIQGPQAKETGDEVSPQQLDRLDSLAKTADQEVTRLMGLELSPFAGEPSEMRDLRAGLREWLVQNTVRNDTEVRNAINQVLNRRRQNGRMDMPGPGIG